MTGAEATALIAEMAATWPQKEITAPETAIWRQTLAPWPVQMARKVVAQLRAESHWLPTHATFTERITELAKRQPGERELPAPRVCGMCGNTGWTDHDPARNVVRRCGCRLGQQSTEHKTGCTCSSCHYGFGAVAAYRAGEVSHL